MSEDLLIYGSYGYTGELIVELALKQGLHPTLAGRNSEKVKAQAEAAGLPYRVFDLEDSAAILEGLKDMKVVLHCAGPFAHTALPMAKACLKTGVHYLDITGEIKVFETMAAMDKAAQERGVMLLPGAGFDVVPTDCLAAHLKERLPNAQDLVLAFYGLGRASHGTMTTIVENIGEGGCIRKDGRLSPVPPAWKVKDIDFGGVTRTAMTIPWGDVSTAWYSTGIPNIMVYMAAPASMRRFSKLSRYIGPILASGPVQRFMKSRIAEGGPSLEERTRGYSLIWGKATDPEGVSVEARLKTPEGYTLTALTAVRIAEKVLAGDAPPGFQTPSKAYGADFICEIEGVERH